MQNWTTTTSDRNAADVTHSCPHIVTATSRHDVTEIAPEDHGEPGEQMKVYYENPFEDLHYH